MLGLILLASSAACEPVEQAKEKLDGGGYVLVMIAKSGPLPLNIFRSPSGAWVMATIDGKLFCVYGSGNESLIAPLGAHV